jgi:TPR repeat protein
MARWRGRAPSARLALLLVVLAVVLVAHGARQCEQGECPGGPLRPASLPRERLFSAFERNHTMVVGGEGGPQHALAVAEGTVRWQRLESESRFAVLPALMRPDEVRAVLALLNRSEAELPFDQDPDSVDGFASHEMFVFDYTMGGGDYSSAAKPLGSHPARVRVREELDALLRPVTDERITPYVRARYPEQCGGPRARGCRPCYSLIRRYRQHERRSHPAHYDHHALVTVVTSLSEFGAEYTGGLYVSAERSARHTLALRRGDAVVHQGDLLHGVQVSAGERWSWIMWFRDSDTCEDHGHEWHRACAEAGQPVCQHVHANKVTSTPGLSQQEAFQKMVQLTLKAAEGGVGGAMFKMGRAFLKKLPSPLPFDPQAAARWLRRAANEEGDPESSYTLAQMLLDGTLPTEQPGADRAVEAVALFENAALSNSVFAMYNLGVAHLYGFGVASRDLELAYEWFLAAGLRGLPEGLYAASLYAGSVGRDDEARNLQQQAHTLGFGQPWRKAARDHTGAGGVPGVSLHSKWPVGNGPSPPEW